MADDDECESEERVYGAFDPETKTIFLAREEPEDDQEDGDAE